MSTITRTYTFTDGTTAYGSQVESEVQNIVTTWNNHDAATSAWTNVKVSGTAANPMECKSSAASAEFDIDCTGASGTPIVTWRRSGTTYFTFGVDGAASNLFKFGTTALTTNVAMQIPTTGVQVQFAVGAVGTPSLSFIGDATTGLYRKAASDIGFSCGGTLIFDVGTTGISISSGVIFSTDGSVSAPAYTFGLQTTTGIYRAGSGDLRITAASSDVAKFTSSGITLLGGQLVGRAASAVGSPAFSFDTDLTKGMYSSGTNQLAFSVNSQLTVRLSTSGVTFYAAGSEFGDWDTTGLYPVPTNTYSCGKSGQIWTAVYATNTTIQTSHSTFKNSIRYITDPCVPRGAIYRWNEGMGQKTDRDFIGWIADPLPKEAYEWKANGEPDYQLVHTNAVVGELCAGWWNHEERIKKLEEKIAA